MPVTRSRLNSTSVRLVIASQHEARPQSLKRPCTGTVAPEIQRAASPTTTSTVRQGVSLQRSTLMLEPLALATSLPFIRHIERYVG